MQCWEFAERSASEFNTPLACNKPLAVYYTPLRALGPTLPEYPASFERGNQTPEPQNESNKLVLLLLPGFLYCARVTQPAPETQRGVSVESGHFDSSIGAGSGRRAELLPE